MTGNEAIAATLAATDLFRGAPGAVLEHLAERATVRPLRRGQTLFLQGDPADAFFIVREGLVKVFVTSNDGDELVLATLEPGNTFGELALFDGNPRSASAEALAPTTLVSVQRDALMEVLREHPEVFDRMLTVLGTLIRRLTHQAADLALLDLQGRVAKLLVSMAEERADENGELELPVTQGELARMVGGSRQTVNQILRGFEVLDWLSLDGRCLKVLRPDRLRARAGMRD